MSGVCACGCGARVAPARRFVAGHQGRGRVPSNKLAIEDGFTIEERGYKTPCYVWRHGLKEGYAVVNRNGRPATVVRIRYEEQVGPFPEGMVPDHLCRVRACVRLDHIEPVTTQVNAQRGAMAKVTPAIVREIRRRRAAGERLRVIAADIGISNQAVSNIARRQRWANIE